MNTVVLILLGIAAVLAVVSLIKATGKFELLAVAVIVIDVAAALPLLAALGRT